MFLNDTGICHRLIILETCIVKPWLVIISNIQIQFSSVPDYFDELDIYDYIICRLDKTLKNKNNLTLNNFSNKYLKI